MFHLLQTRFNRYRFYDDDTCTLNLVSYLHIPEAYHYFRTASVPIMYVPSGAILASSPDYASFPQLYPEFFI